MTRQTQIQIAVEMAKEICNEHGGRLHSITQDGIWYDKDIEEGRTTGIIPFPFPILSGGENPTTNKKNGG